MENNVNQNVMLEEEESAFDLKQIWTLLVLNWHWILISMIACMLIALAYLWFTPSTLTVTGKMQIIDKSKEGGGASMAALSSLPLGLGSSLGAAASASMDFEKEILTSTPLVRNIIYNLNLHTEYRLCKWGKKDLLYQNNPLTVTLDTVHLQWFDQELPLTYHEIRVKVLKDDKSYKVETKILESGKEDNLPVQVITNFPATIKTEAGILTLTENKLSVKQAKTFEGNYTMEVIITPPTIAAKAFIGRLKIEPPSKSVKNIVNLTLTDENLMRGIDFISQLVEVYNLHANEEKNEEARKTDQFVNERLAKVDAELGSSDAAWENTKKNFQITDPSVDAGDAMAKKSQYEQQLVSIGTELQLHDYLSEYVNNPANLYEIIPVGIAAGAGVVDGTSASGTATLLVQHNTLVNQRKDLLKSVSEMSPQFQRVTQSIQELHPAIQTALKRDRQAIIMRQNTLQREYGRYMGRVGSAPQMERVLTEIGRQREIKQGVYLVMLQKREETAMELANTTDKGKLIDDIIAGAGKPQKKMVLLVALFLGALLPAGILFLLQLLKTKLDTRSELEAATKLPVLAEIPLNDNGEGIRTARTNLLLAIPKTVPEHVEGVEAKTILVASNSDGDGKSYIAQQLTDSLAAIGKKVLLINGDLRSLSLSKGHPSDILAGSEFAQQIATAKSSNDYIILDSPALNQYADAYQLASFADATVYVVKAGQTDKSTIEALANDNRLPNLHLVLNAIDTTTKKYKYLNKK